MSSAKERLEQVNEHVRGGQPARGTSSPELICKTYEHSPGNNIATITFSNAAKLNVLSGDIIDSLVRKCEELGKDDALRAVVVTGAPPTSPGKAPSFIGGADVQELSQISSTEEATKYITRVHQACAAILNIPVPVIARVNGFAIGAGLEIMAACDLRIATKDSKFGMPEVKIGVPSVVEAALFPGMIGWGRTRRLIYLAENISADMAEQWGLVERIVENETELNDAVEEWVNIILTMGPKAMRNQKRLMTKWQNSTLAEGIQAGIGSLAEAYTDGGKEPKKYMKPFLGRKR